MLSVLKHPVYIYLFIYFPEKLKQEKFRVTHGTPLSHLLNQDLTLKIGE